MAVIQIEPDVQQKLAILASEAADELTDPPRPEQPATPDLTGSIYHATRERGGKMPLLKVLQTNACRYACAYCFTSCAIRRKRTTFKPDDLATTFIALRSSRQVDGLFLSSGIVPDADTTMEKMLATVERLRLREHYTGYLHLKLIPGAAFEYVERAVQLADRVSLNLEAPNALRLAVLAPDKEFADSMWSRLVWASDLIRRARKEGWRGARSLTTQFVVGAAGESDQELLTTVQRAHRELDLRRAYFSAFHPIAHSPCPIIRPKIPCVPSGFTRLTSCCATTAIPSPTSLSTRMGCFPATRRRSRPGPSDTPRISRSRLILLRARGYSVFPA